MLVYDRKLKTLVNEPEYKQEVLQFLYGSKIGRILLKTIFARQWFSKFYGLYISSPLSKGKINSVAVSANTVGEYMDAFCETYMIDRVKRYDIKGKSVFEQQDKYYFEDLGLRNYLCRDKRSLDVEKVLEGAVYLKLKRSGYEVYMGQLSGKEIDFVARRGDEVIYVQVALQVSSAETYEREFGNLKLIKDNYPKYVVTMDPNVGLIHDSGIVACSARQFLLNLVC